MMPKFQTGPTARERDPLDYMLYGITVIAAVSLVWVTVAMVMGA